MFAVMLLESVHYLTKSELCPLSPGNSVNNGCSWQNDMMSRRS